MRKKPHTHFFHTRKILLVALTLFSFFYSDFLKAQICQPAAAGPNQTVCVSTPTALMAANTATGVGVGKWTLTSGGGIITNSLIPNTTITGMPVGANVFAWTITSGTCVPSVSNVTITVNALPSVASAGANQTVCVTAGATMAAQSPTVGTGLWSVSAGTGVFTTPTSSITPVTGLSVGNNIYNWTISNAPCVPSIRSVTITATAPPTLANAGANQTICISTGSTTMAGNVPGVGVGRWIKVSGVGVITNSLLANTTITGLAAAGTSVFTWSITNAPCAASTSNMTITTNALPTVANAGASQTICVTTGSTTMAGNVPAVGIGKWIKVSGLGVITNSDRKSTRLNSSH